VLRIQPNGPIILSGLCFGGCVAYEMACQLRARGRKVELLVLLECFNDRWLVGQSFPGRAWAQTALVARRAAYHLARAVRLGPLIGWEYFIKRLAVAKAVLDGARRQREFEQLAEMGRPLSAELSKAGFANRAATRAWIPTAYDGRVVLLGGAEPRAGFYAARCMGWAGLLQGEVVCALFSDELRGLFAEPAVHQVARRLAQEINRVGSPIREGLFRSPAK
jgi:aspartate racemase